MFAIDLNKESAAVLLRCLVYGQAAINQNEHKNGIGKKIEKNCEMLRRQVASKLADVIIKEGVPLS